MYTHWYYFSWVTFSLLCMHHISRVNFPQSCNNRNTIQHPHTICLAFAFLKIMYWVQLFHIPVTWSPIVDMHLLNSAYVCCHTLHLLLHIIRNSHFYPTATCAPIDVFSWVTFSLLCMPHLFFSYSSLEL